eukprot:5265235-Pleurochrysis_carterae.AAC.1
MAAEMRKGRWQSRWAEADGRRDGQRQTAVERGKGVWHGEGQRLKSESGDRGDESVHLGLVCISGCGRA